MAAVVDENVVIVFARLPVVGKVKTRLAKGIGAKAACELYQQVAEHILREASAQLRVRCMCSEDSEAALVKNWIASMGLDAEVLPQEQSIDLGVRMHNAVQAAFAGGARKVVVTGSDIPDISSAILADAMRALDTHDVVLGPAADGGYYLIGLRAPCQQLFEGITWSTNTVLSMTLQNAVQAGLAAAPAGSLPQLIDWDTWQDVQTWLQDPSSSNHPLYQSAVDLCSPFLQ